MEIVDIQGQKMVLGDHIGWERDNFYPLCFSTFE